MLSLSALKLSGRVPLYHTCPNSLLSRTHTHTAPESSWLILALIAWILFGFIDACFSLLCLNCPVSSRAHLAKALCCAFLYY